MLNRFIVCTASLVVVTNVSVQSSYSQSDNKVTQESLNASNGLRFGALNADLLAADPRLIQRKVEIVETSIYLRAAMRQWSAKTGIAFECRDEGGDASGRWRVIMALRDAVTVAEAMDALRSVLSEQGATWQWRRTGTAPNYQYRLVCPANWAKHQDDLRAQVQDAFEEELSVSLRGSKMTPEELKLKSASDPTGALQTIMNNPHIAEGVAAFVSSLTPEQLKGVMTGAMPKVEVSFGSLSEEGQKFATNRMREYAEKGINVGNEIPTGIVAKYVQFGNELTPCLALMVGHETGAFGHTYVGGKNLENRQRNLLAQGVFLNNDAKQSAKYDSAMNEKITENLTDKTQPTAMMQAWNDVHGKHRLLSELANAKSPRVNFMACLPQSKGSNGSPSAYGQTLNGLLATLNQECIFSKWNHDILLIRNINGFALHDGVEGVASQELCEFATTHQDDWVKQKSVPMTDILQMAKLGNVAQWENLYTEFGMAFSCLDSLKNEHALFVQMALLEPETLKELISPAGVRLEKLPKAFTSTLGISTGTPLSARVICGDKLTPPLPRAGFNQIAWALVSDSEEAAQVTPKRILRRIIYMEPKPWDAKSSLF